MALLLQIGKPHCVRLRKGPQLQASNWYRMIAHGCASTNYCKFAMCEGLLLWLSSRNRILKYPLNTHGRLLPNALLSRAILSARWLHAPSHRKRLHARIKWASQNKKDATKRHRKVVASSDVGCGANVPTLAPVEQTTGCPKEAPNDGELVASPQKFDGMQVH